MNIKFVIISAGWQSSPIVKMAGKGIVSAVEEEGALIVAAKGVNKRTLRKILKAQIADAKCL